MTESSNRLQRGLDRSADQHANYSGMARHVLIGLAFVWCVTVLAAPLLSGSRLSAGRPAGSSLSARPGAGLPAVSHTIYAGFAKVCHQREDRSFHLPSTWNLASHQLAVCHRCSGLYLGMLAGLLLWPTRVLARWRALLEKEPRFVVVAAIPLLIDVAAAPWNTPTTRFVTGLLASFPIALLLLRAGEQILESMSTRTLEEEKV